MIMISGKMPLCTLKGSKTDGAGENNTEPWIEAIDFENRRYPR
jgi:hypothetical protein